MGEKEGKGDQKVKKVESEKKAGGGGGGDKKKDDGPSTVVLKIDMHCEGCAIKIKRSVKGFDGVEGVTADLASNKLTVVGKVDPVKLRERVETKTRKKVEIISPTGNPAKLKDGGGDAKKQAAAAGGGGGGAKEGGGGAKEQKQPAEDKKSKAPQSSTVVLKIRLHCEGCIQRIRKSILKIKGVEGVTVDAGKDLVTVKGTMDPKTLPAVLKDKLKRNVELVPAKKDDGGASGGKKGGDGGGDNKKDGDGGGEKKKDNVSDKKDGGEKKKEGGDGGGDKKEGGGGDKKKEESGGGEKAVASIMEVNKMEYYGTPYPYRYEMVHAPQMFSDENPNACSIM